YGIYFLNTNNSDIIDCKANYNVDGIRLYNSHNITITNSSTNTNAIYGIALIKSNFNVIENNTGTDTIGTNGVSGIYLEQSHNNTITGNSINNNYIGIQLINSYNNTISPNSFYGNDYNVVYGTIIINGGTPSSGGGGGGGSGSISDENPIVIIIIFIVIGSIVSVSSLAVRSSVKKNKISSTGKINGYSKEQSAKAKKERMLKHEAEASELETARAAKGLQKKTKAFKDEYQKKKEFLEPASIPQELIEAEQAELAKTEAEMEIDKQKFICVVHRGTLYGSNIYLCKHCETFYCERCAKVLKLKGEKCWNCDNEIEIEITEKDQMTLLEKKAVDLIEEIINERKFIREFVNSNKNIGDFPQIKDQLFSLITPEELDKIDLIELSPEDKKRFIKELILLDLEEREEHLDEMLKK
ncbi:MAG: NosD domain-containing protein, partial [Candidatus Hermodarchaeota archaeon]